MNFGAMLELSSLLYICIHLSLYYKELKNNNNHLLNEKMKQFLRFLGTLNNMCSLLEII